MNNSNRLVQYLLPLTLILGFGLRMTSIQFGLPHLYHADEPIVVNHALAYGTGDLNPHYFKFPPLITYLLFMVYGFYYIISLLLGRVSSVADFQNLFLSDPSSFYLIARIIFGAGLGTLGIAVFYRLLRRFFSNSLALTASFFLATNFMHVRNSHYFYLDIPLMLVMILSYFPILNVLTQKRARDYYLFGVCLGLAVGTKYNGFFIVIPFLYAHFAAQGWNWRGYVQWKLMAAVILSLLTFVAVNPYALLDYPAFLRDILSLHEFEGYLGWTHHFVYSLRHALGLPMLSLAMVGLILNLFKPEKKKLAFIFFAVPYYVLLCHFSEQHARYILPLLPSMMFFAADALDRLGRVLPKFAKLVSLAGILVVTLPSLSRIYHLDRILQSEDIRTTALGWIKENIPQGSRIALDSSFFMPRLKPTLAQLQDKAQEAHLKNQPANIKRMQWMIDDAKAHRRPRYELYFLNKNPDSEFLFAKPVLPYDVGVLKDAGIEYVLAVRLSPDHLRDFYEALDRGGEKIRRFTPYFDSHRDWPLSTRPLTGAPLTWEELVSRRQNGQIIDLYKLSPAQPADPA